MGDSIPGGIWPPHEAFYLEAMLHCTTTALRAASDVTATLDVGSQYLPSSSEWQGAAQRIIDGVQVMILQAAAISRYFWPARSDEPHLSRAARLRAGLGIGDSSALRSRALRNRLEHLDERLDTFCQELVAGVVVPTYVGPIGDDSDVPLHVFRAYYTDMGLFEILGERFHVQPVLDEIHALHERLVRCAEAGGRIPRGMDL